MNNSKNSSKYYDIKRDYLRKILGSQDSQKVCEHFPNHFGSFRELFVFGPFVDSTKCFSPYNDHGVTYGEVFHRNEVEQSTYNFEFADIDRLFGEFDMAEKMCATLIENKLPLPAYEQVLTASHSFNLLDARHAIGVTERARYIGRVRAMARSVAQTYFENREQLGFPRGASTAVKKKSATAAKKTAAKG